MPDRLGRDSARVPATVPGLRVGLYGGSFDPPHAGHRHVAQLALKRLQLDRVWWLIGPGNPLKDLRGLPGSAARAAATRGIAHHPRMQVTQFEAALGLRYSVDTVRYLARHRPTTRFVWIMGADSFATFHRWRDWRTIAALVPIAVVDRPGWTIKAQLSKAAATLAGYRVDAAAASTLAYLQAPAWTFVGGPRWDLSSTAIRDRLLKSLDQR